MNLVTVCGVALIVLGGSAVIRAPSITAVCVALLVVGVGIVVTAIGFVLYRSGL